MYKSDCGIVFLLLCISPVPRAIPTTATLQTYDQDSMVWMYSILA